MDQTSAIQAIASHVSVRQFSGDPVPDELILHVLRTACRAPTSSNVQAYSIVVIRDPAVRRELSILCGNQPHVAATPVLLAFCADLARLERACRMHGQVLVGDTLEMGLVATVDAALTGMCAMTAAESLGLGCVIIGGMRNQPLEVARILALPPRCFVVFGMCLGWPAERPLPRPRLPPEAVIHFEKYSDAGIENLLADHDRHVEDYQTASGKSDLSWTARIARDYSKGRRTELRAALAKLGLSFK